MLPRELTTIFATKELSDIIIPGFVWDHRNVRTFTPVLKAIYLEFEDRLVLLQSIGRHWRLQMSLADQIECHFDLDPKDEFAVSSVLEVLGGEGGCSVTRVQTWVSADCDAASGIVKGALFHLNASPCQLFIDPLNIFGIRLTVPTDLDGWLEWYSHTDGPLAEESWQHPAFPILED